MNPYKPDSTRDEQRNARELRVASFLMSSHYVGGTHDPRSM